MSREYRVWDFADRRNVPATYPHLKKSQASSLRSRRKFVEGNRGKQDQSLEG